MNTTFFAILQWPEILLILVVVLILFGAKRLPELAKGLGQGIKEFKRATRDVQTDLQQAIDGMDSDSASSSSYSNREKSPDHPDSSLLESESESASQSESTQSRRKDFLEGTGGGSKD